jgi:exopolysaccharide production protein ExoY
MASLALFAAASPVLVGSALAIAWRSGRTPLIAHRRVGWQGSPLWMLKLRTMWPAEAVRSQPRGWIEYIDDDLGPQLKHPVDPRVTSPFARFCRRHSIDELPQLWHVIRGQMSLVGPRPMTEAELRRHYGSAAREILQVRPGLAGLWQISGRNRLSYAERRDLDLKLVRGRCARLYIEILLRTVPEVLTGSGSW